MLSTVPNLHPYPDVLPVAKVLEWFGLVLSIYGCVNTEHTRNELPLNIMLITRSTRVALRMFSYVQRHSRQLTDLNDCR